jgi:hypothetical protein
MRPCFLLSRKLHVNHNIIVGKRLASLFTRGGISTTFCDSQFHLEPILQLVLTLEMKAMLRS